MSTDPFKPSWIDTLVDWVAFLLVGWLLLIIVFLFPKGHGK